MLPLEPLDIAGTFAPTYAVARARFKDAARAAGGTLDAHVHDSHRGPDGGEIAIDVARFGPEKAETVFMAICGTHGLEGYCGSPVLIDWMRTGGAKRLPKGVGALLVHAINPWGFAHNSRTTESNVDLNRNFVDHEGGKRPENAGYATLHDAICPAEWSDASRAAYERAALATAKEKGEGFLIDSLFRGQYAHPDGVFYGGTKREWSNRKLEEICGTHLKHARRVGVLDWHTGIGKPGEPVILTFNTAGDGLYEQVCSWWGKDFVDAGLFVKGVPRPRYTGLVFQGVQQFAKHAQVAGAVIEFGTKVERMDTFHALRLDVWLKFKAPKGDPRRAAFETEVREAFSLSDPGWQRMVLGQARLLHEQMVQGLGRWR
ncbi:MAG: DUF2817 domain-containing protein [Alphaproteobacteria bacterium]|nr:DUF2817 domain-containing protein [Alphaproteobacteria bacterium]